MSGKLHYTWFLFKIDIFYLQIYHRMEIYTRRVETKSYRKWSSSNAFLINIWWSEGISHHIHVLRLFCRLGHGVYWLITSPIHYRVSLLILYARLLTLFRKFNQFSNFIHTCHPPHWNGAWETWWEAIDHCTMAVIIVLTYTLYNSACTYTHTIF